MTDGNAVAWRFATIWALVVVVVRDNRLVWVSLMTTVLVSGMTVVMVMSLVAEPVKVSETV
jgi:hypothetical protein